MKICITCEGVSETDAATCAHCQTPLIDTSEVHFPQRRGEADAANPWLGRVIAGKYRIEEVLGQGGMGTVFRAIHEVSLVSVALKILHPRFAARPEYRTWFLAEARKAGQVIHENTARVQDVGETADGTVFIAVEFVAGLTLHDWIRTGRLRDPAIVVDVLEQMARALAAAHEAGVVHRDLSPRNVMIAVRGGRPIVKILDFGIAKGAPQSVTARMRDAAALAAGAPVGFASPPYSAPEHLASREVDLRADLYSLGAIAYEALYGRLPVRGSNTDELARETLEGRLRPAGPIPGAPKALVQLVRQLLATDPEQRPSSALLVAESLSRIRNARGIGLATVSIAAFVLCAVLFAVTFAPSNPADPFLQVAAGPGRLILAPTPVAAERTQELQSRDLLAAAFTFGGFDPADLRVHASRDGRVLGVLALGDALVVDGRQLELDFGSAAPLVDDLVRWSADGAVDLKFEFGRGERRPLAHARVRVDDIAPAVTLERVPLASPLNGRSVLNVRVDEACTLHEVAVVVRFETEAPTALRIPLEPPVAERSIRLATLLAEREPFAGCQSLGRVAMYAEAVDRAGNEGRSSEPVFGELDLRAPRILAVGSSFEGQVLTFDAEGAEVRIQLMETEPDLAVVVDGPGREQELYAPATVRTVGERLEVRLRPVDGPRPFTDGRYRFVVRDRHGNESEFLEDLKFRSAALQPSLRAGQHDVAETGHLRFRRLGDEFVVDGDPLLLEFHCSKLYRPLAAHVEPSSRGLRVPCELRRAAVGNAEILMPALGDGRYVLRVRYTDARGENESEHAFALRSLSSTPELRLPDLADSDYLPALEDLAVLKLQDGRIRQGAAWQLRPDDARLFRGSLWVGLEDRLERFTLPAMTAADDPLLRGFEPRRGLNRIAVQLRDVLGRTVLVFRGDRRAPKLAQAAGAGLDEVAAFYWHDAPITTDVRTLRVEFGQPATLALRSALPFGREVRLSVGGEPIAPRRIDRSGRDTLLVFGLEFEQVRGAANLRGLSAADFAAGRSARLSATLRTPAGTIPVEVDVQTVRSGLRPLTLGDLVGARPAPDAIRSIRMVPVTAPIDAAFEDPVPARAAHRRSFRTTPAGLAVSDVPDFFLQHAEVTRAQYQAAVDAVLDAAAERGPELTRALVHAADPLGADRLTPARLVPRAFAEHPERWHAALAAAPARPVSGVDYFQAHVFVRAVGLLLTGEPDLLRLPLGVELEIAAFGTRAPARPVLNGAARSGRGVAVVDWLAVQQRIDDLERWPLSRQESAAMGDRIETELGNELVAIDFGVREWVLDLPYTESGDESRLLREWLRNHDRHVQRAVEFARGESDDMREDLRASFRVTGVVRGAAFGERGVLFDGLNAERIDAGSERLPTTVPGVVRGLHLRRDGEGLVPGRVDPHLRRIGLRLAGGRRFVDHVRLR